MLLRFCLLCVLMAVSVVSSATGDIDPVLQYQYQTSITDVLRMLDQIGSVMAPLLFAAGVVMVVIQGIGTTFEKLIPTVLIIAFGPSFIAGVLGLDIKEPQAPASIALSSIGTQNEGDPPVLSLVEQKKEKVSVPTSGVNVSNNALSSVTSFLWSAIELAFFLAAVWLGLRALNEATERGMSFEEYMRYKMLEMRRQAEEQGEFRRNSNLPGLNEIPTEFSDDPVNDEESLSSERGSRKIVKD